MTAWDGELVPLSTSSTLTGSVAAVSRSTLTEAGITIAHAEPDHRYIWRIRAGTCDQPGSVMGASNDYPDLFPTGPSGGATAETTLSVRLLIQYDYHGLLLDESGATVACGALTLK